MAEFDWMTPKIAPHASSSSTKRLIMYRKEVAQRAGMFYRLGYTAEQAIARLCQNAAWDFELGTAGAPDGLGTADIQDIVNNTFARRPAS